MMLSLCVVGAFAQGKADVSLNEVKQGKTQKVQVNYRSYEDSTLVMATALIPQSWGQLRTSYSEKVYGNGEAVAIINASNIGSFSLYNQMMSKDEKDYDYFSKNSYGKAYNVEKYNVCDSLPVVRIDAVNEKLKVRAFTYVIEEGSHMILANCIMPEEVASSSKKMLKKYIETFDNIVYSVKIKDTGIKYPEREKDTIILHTEELTYTLVTPAHGIYDERKEVKMYTYDDGSAISSISVDKWGVEEEELYKMLNVQGVGDVVVSIMFGESGKDNIKSFIPFRVNIKPDKEAIIIRVERKDVPDHKNFVIGIYYIGKDMIMVKTMIKDGTDIYSHIRDIISIFKSVNVSERQKEKIIVPQVDTLRIKIENDTTRMLCVPLKKGWRGEKDGKTKHTFIYMTQGENMGVVPTAWKYEDYTSPARQAAMCKSLEKGQEASSVRYKKCGDYDVFEIFKVKKGNPSPQKKDMHMFLMYGNGMRINVWYFCPVNTDVEKVSGKFEEMLKTWEVK